MLHMRYCLIIIIQN